MFRQDYLIRMFEQLGAVIAKMAGFSRNKNFAAAQAEAEKGWDLLGVRRELVDVLDGPSLAELLGTPEMMRGAADLLIEEARALTGRGDPATSAVCYRRAFELYLEARAIAPVESDEATLLELSRFVPVNQIDPRYR